ncbi:Myosin type-2 heavy chain 1 [Phlyctochytrium planicorne]|nr:Myosin type-2 heavy chain 1 [Phlyctochytrium planicorne]
MPSPEVEKALSEYKKDVLAYFTDEQEGWVVGKMVSKTWADDAGKISMDFILVASGKDITVTFTNDSLVKNSFADLPPLKNPEIMELCDDLAQLSYLHEPAVFSGVKNRFHNRYIYTYSGIVLIAMNPFDYLDIYSVDIMKEYARKRRDELEPHLFAVATEAYRAMLEGVNQSIIVSGESGAGKTQSTKYIMRYFATVDSLSKLDDVDILMRPELLTSGGNGMAGGQSEIEQAVLATNPILEAFGNAKTTRNDNSSRFGKFIELFFSDPITGSVKITGAQIRTYLLERSRLVFQPATERNYHIFYQLCVAAPAAEKEELGLTVWQDFFYLNQGKAGVVRTINDIEEFEATQKAFSTIGISVSMQWRIFRICAALLHLGNVKITAAENDSTEILDTDPALIKACKLLELDLHEFKKWLTKRQITTRGETFEKGLKADQALVARDSIAKFIYTRLFDWLVSIVNKNLKRDHAVGQNFIGVLDIYGFEHFEVNSFEQFCINYANEKLQQEFNSHVFRLEQELYIREKIVWKMIGFNDNQPCIDLIEGKLGILDLLDEESRLPTGSDTSLISKLNTRFAVPGQKFYAKPRFGNNAFTVRHYAVDVTYTIDGFIEKNKDTVSPEQLGSLKNSRFEFLVEVISSVEATEGEDAAAGTRKVASDSTLSRRPTAGNPKKPTLGSMFKGSLVQLMETIRATESHYIRCIKPNMAKAAFGFDGPMVLSQLRACGVLETIKISCAGYPNKMTHEQFAHRYYLLVNSSFWTMPERELCEKIVTTVISDVDKYQFGITQVFLRAGQIALFENRRTERQTYLMILGQKNIKKFIQRNRYLRMRQAAIKIQAVTRGYLARRKYHFLRETAAAIKIQKVWRGYHARKMYQKKRVAATKIQAVWRGYRARKYFKNIVQERAAVKIQAQWRGYLARRSYKLTLKKLVYIQSCIRRKYARRQLLKLREEARSVGKLQELNYTLESKVITVSQQLHERNEEVRTLQERVNNLEEQIRGWKERFGKVVDDKKSISSELTATTATAKEIQTLMEQRDAVTKDRDRLQAIVKKRDEELASNFEELKKLRERTRFAGPNKRGSTSSAMEDSNLVAQLRAENQQLKRLLGGSTGQAPGLMLNTTTLFESPGHGTPVLESASVASPRSSFRENFTNNSIHGHGHGHPHSSHTRSRPSVRRANTYIDGDIFADAERERIKSGRPSVSGNTHAHPTSHLAASPLLGPNNDSAFGSANGYFPSVYGGMAAMAASPVPRFDDSDTFSHLDNAEFDIEPHAKLLESPTLLEELKEALVLKLPIPEDLPPLESPEATRFEFLFPAHLIGYVIKSMLEQDMLLQIQTLTNQLLQDIFVAGSQQPEDDFRPLFWSSNTHELSNVVGFLIALEARKPNSKAHANILKKLLADLETLNNNILSTYLKEVKKHVASMAVSAILETQDLPGLKSETNGFWGLFRGGDPAANPEDNMTSLKSFLSGLHRIMQTYCLPREYQHRILGELVRVIAVTGFNSLLKRRNFINFRRGCQIQYNVTQMEEWCLMNDVQTGPAHLQRLLQASKVLTMNKRDPQDAEAIYDVAFLLNFSQVKKLFSTYPPTDPDSPMSQAFLNAVVMQAEREGPETQVFISLDPEPTYANPALRKLPRIEKSIPFHMQQSLPTLAQLLV